MEPPGVRHVRHGAAVAFTPYHYQVQAAQTALRRMRGRAILADEVGLGKTIEAGWLLAELRQRGLADKTLVVTPAGLVGQAHDDTEFAARLEVIGDVSWPGLAASIWPAGRPPICWWRSRHERDRLGARFLAALGGT